MLIAHISDFHVFAEKPETPLVRPDAAAVARKVVDDIAAFSPAIDAVMFTGDLTDGGSRDDYDLLSNILAPLSMPVLVVPGNHDKRDGVRATFGDRLPFGPGATLDYEYHIGDVRILALDTLKDGHVEGRLSETQLDWLAERLATSIPALTLILMHHPAFPSRIDALDHMALRDGREEFGTLIADYDGPLRILSGHIHRPFQALWKGKLCAVAGSPVFQHDLRLEVGADEPGTGREPYSYFLHKISDADAVTIHSRYVAL
jgi:3',5'-cyclic-AMP phosphodiesterase